MTCQECVRKTGEPTHWCWICGEMLAVGHVDGGAVGDHYAEGGVGKCAGKQFAATSTRQGALGLPQVFYIVQLIVLVGLLCPALLAVLISTAILFLLFAMPCAVAEGRGSRRHQPTPVRMPSDAPRFRAHLLEPGLGKTTPPLIVPRRTKDGVAGGTRLGLVGARSVPTCRPVERDSA